MASAIVKGGGRVSELGQGVIARFIAGSRMEIVGAGMNGWMNPGQPLHPVAPQPFQPRRYDYPVAQNLYYQPKAGEGESYWTLRALADGYDLLRIVIETRKDQMARIEWEMGVDAVPGEPPSKTKERQAGDQRLKVLNDFWKRPDGEHPFAEWQRMLLEEMYVIDAPCLLPRWRLDGGIWGFDVLDGATINILIDAQGRQPLPPQPAYQQIIKGVPACDLQAADPKAKGQDQLIFMPRNVRANRLYGFSPVEQIVMSVNIALRRQISQLQYYTDGNIPDAFVNLPENFNEDQITQYEALWNAKFVTTAARRKINFIPAKASVTFTKDITLKDDFDEYLVRKIAYAFGINPSSLVKMTNRASGEQMAEDAKAEGLEPCITWMKNALDGCNEFMGFPDIKWHPSNLTKENPLQQAQIDQIYLSTVDADGNTVLRANDVRGNLGMDPLSGEDDHRNDEPELAPVNAIEGQQIQEQKADEIKAKVLQALGFATKAKKKVSTEYRRARSQQSIRLNIKPSREY